MVLRILNLEVQLNCMIGSKVTAILMPFFQKILKLQMLACGVFIQRQFTGILHCALRFSFGSLYLKWDSKKTLSEPNKPIKLAPFLRVFFGIQFQIYWPKLNLSAQRNIPVYCLWINTPHAYVWSFLMFWRKRWLNCCNVLINPAI